jgi:hypothetical protein
LEAGETVPLLALIDAVWFLDDRTEPAQRLTWTDRFLRNLGHFGPDILLHKLMRRLQYTYHDQRVRLSKLELALRQRIGLKTPLILEHWALLAAYHASLDAYACPRYLGNVALYVASEWRIEALPPQAIEGITVRGIHGYHETLFEGDQLSALAEQLQRDIDTSEHAKG